MRALTVALVAVSIGFASAVSLRGDVKTQEKGQVKFEGMLGRMVNMFGGKAAKEGVVSNVAVKGDRKATLHDNGGQIVDLAEEKVYDLDVKKKTYKVKTFEQIRQEIREAREKAEKDAKQGGGEQPGETGRELEVDFDVKETGQKKAIAGHDTREVIVTITLREKDKTLEQSGGMVITQDMWLAPRIAAMKEITDFEIRYAKKLDAAGAAGMSMDQLAAALAMYPGLQKGLARMQAESAKLDGTPLETVMVVKSVKSPEQMSQAKDEESGSGSGLGGMLARRMMKKKQDPSAGAESTVMTITHQVLSVGTSVTPNDVQVPADFKLKS
jgi:hypothetical protein